MDGSIRFGVLLPTGKAQWGEGTDPRELIDFAVRAEALGYASVWANDSVLSPRIETLVMLATVAPLTTRVTLGTATLLPVLRRPVQAAQALASLDLLTGGRLAVGVGAGFPGRFGAPLHTLSEVPWPGRFARLDDTVALWRQLWSSQGPTSFHGKILHFDELPRGLAPYRPAGPPILLGGATPAALARTGRLYDGWLPYPPDPADYRTGLLAVRQAAADTGRDPSAITPALFVTVLISDEVDGGRRTLDEYSRANYGLTLDALQTVQAVIAGPPRPGRLPARPLHRRGGQAHRLPHRRPRSHLAAGPARADRGARWYAGLTHYHPVCCSTWWCPLLSDCQGVGTTGWDLRSHPAALAAADRRPDRAGRADPHVPPNLIDRVIEHWSG